MNLLVLFALVCLLPYTTHALHYRGGTFYWDRIDNKKVNIFWRLAFKKVGDWIEEYPCDDIGQKIKAEDLNMLKCTTCSYNKQKIIHELPLTCVGTSAKNDWNLYEGSYLYDSEKSKFTMSYETVGACIHSSWMGLKNYGNGMCWNLQTKVDISSENNSPRVLAGLPLHRIRQGCDKLIDLRPTDPDRDDTIRCRWADDSRQECPEFRPDNLKQRVCGSPSEDHADIIEDECLIRFDATNANIGNYGVSVMIEDFDERSTKAKSTVPFQFLIEVTERGSCDGPTVQLKKTCSEIAPGEPWTNTVTSTLPKNSEGNEVQELMYTLPMHMTYSQEELPPPGLHVESILSFKTTKTGEYVYSVAAIDAYGSQGKTASGNIYVTDEKPKRKPPPPNVIQDQSYPNPFAEFELDDMKAYWYIKFNGPVSRPEESAYITVMSSSSKKVLARYDASDSDEVEFLDDDPTIARYKPPEGLEAGVGYNIEVDNGFAIVKYSTYCQGETIENSHVDTFNISSALPPQPVVDCGPNEITAYIPKWYISNLPMNELHLIDPLCNNSQDNGTHLTVQFAYDACGTYIMKKSSDVTTFINILRDDPKAYKSSDSITRKKRKVNIKIICDVTGVGIAAVFFDPDTSVTSSELQSATNLKAYLELYQDGYMVPYGIAKEVGFSDRLYFTARAHDRRKEVAIESCRATAKYKTFSSQHDKKFEFIRDGCPVDDTVEFTSPSSFDQKPFSIRTFAMLNYGLEDTVWVTCSFVICNPSNSKSKCKDLNSNNCDRASVGKRRRKDVTDIETLAFLEVQGRMGGDMM